MIRVYYKKLNINTHFSKKIKFVFHIEFWYNVVLKQFKMSQKCKFNNKTHLLSFLSHTDEVKWVDVKLPTR